MLLILLIPLQATFAMQEQAKPSDFSGGNLTANMSSFSGNVTNQTSVLMSDFSGNMTEEDLDYDVAPRDFSGGEDCTTPYSSEDVQDFCLDPFNEFEPSDFSENMSLAAPPDFTSTDFSSENCDTTYPSAACLVAQDLISLSPDQIRGYGLSDKPDYIIEHTLNILDPGNLTKVLQSISAEEISSIKNTLTPQKFDTILSRVPEPQHNELVNSISVPP